MVTIKNFTVRELLSQLDRESYNYGYYADKITSSGDDCDFSDRFDFEKSVMSIRVLCSSILDMLSDDSFKYLDR